MCYQLNSSYGSGPSMSMDKVTIQQISIYNSGCEEVHWKLILTAAAWPICETKQRRYLYKETCPQQAHDRVLIEGSGHSAYFVIAPRVCVCDPQHTMSRHTHAHPS